MMTKEDDATGNGDSTPPAKKLKFAFNGVVVSPGAATDHTLKVTTEALDHQRTLEALMPSSVQTAFETILEQNRKADMLLASMSVNKAFLDTSEAIEREREAKRFEITPPPFDFHAADDRRRERDRREAIETARLVELERLRARDEYEANKAATAGAALAPVAVGNTAPRAPVTGWSPIDYLDRAPGYRWPLYQVLKSEYAAGRPCPKPREVLEIWKRKPPPDLQVMPDGVKYSDSLGNPKEADLKAIGQAIKGLLKR